MPVRPASDRTVTAIAGRSLTGLLVARSQRTIVEVRDDTVVIVVTPDDRSRKM